MPVIEGRKYQRADMVESYCGGKLVLMFHDKGHSLNWVRVEFTAEEFGDMFDRFADWLSLSDQPKALDALMCKR